MAEGFELLRVRYINRDLSSEILAVHAALLYDGNVLYFSGSGHDENPPGGFDAARIYNPTYNTVSQADSPTIDDLFCCGHAFLSDGGLFVAGGTESYDIHAPAAHQFFGGAHHFVGINVAFVYDQVASIWRKKTSMAEGRWYPTCTSLPDGRIFVISGHGGGGSGHHENTMFEIYDPITNTWTVAQSTNPPIRDHGIAMIYYPRLHLLPNGQLFCSSAWETSKDGKKTRMLNPQSGKLTTLGKIPDWHHCDHVYKGANFSSALLPLEPPNYDVKIFICGGKYPRIFDMQLRHQGWQVAGGEINGKRPYDKRAYANAVLLPDGSVLVVNGCNSERGYPLSGGGHDSEAVLFAERYIPDAPYWPAHKRDTWEILSSSTIPRVYHSVALLLSDGRVWIAGSNHDSGRNHGGDSLDHPGTDARELRMEIYSPPYVEAVRPRIHVVNPSNALPKMEYNKPFFIESQDAATITRVVLLRCGSVTHAFDFDQRYVGLKILSQDNRAVKAEGPPSVTIAPSGIYMVFILDKNNIPSVGVFVQLVNPPQPTQPVQHNFAIKEEQKADLDTGIDINIGDFVSVIAEGEIWAGVWFTGNNEPSGWDDPTSDSKFPYHSNDDSFPYSLLGKIGNGPYFWIGNYMERRVMTQTGRLYLRINDNCPGNGSGEFTGTITIEK